MKLVENFKNIISSPASSHEHSQATFQRLMLLDDLRSVISVRASVGQSCKHLLLMIYNGRDLHRCIYQNEDIASGMHVAPLKAAQPGIPRHICMHECESRLHIVQLYPSLLAHPHIHNELI